MFPLQVFDLKGSLRNRNVKTDSGKESCEVVLLDENLLKLIHDNPLYIRSHCKSILRAAIHSDAYFLSSHLIIDYSLLVGRDDATDQLVVGIIGEGRITSNFGSNAPMMRPLTTRLILQIISGRLPGTRGWRWSSNPLESWEVKVGPNQAHALYDKNLHI